MWIPYFSFIDSYVKLIMVVCSIIGPTMFICCLYMLVDDKRFPWALLIFGIVFGIAYYWVMIGDILISAAG